MHEKSQSAPPEQLQLLAAQGPLHLVLAPLQPIAQGEELQEKLQSQPDWQLQLLPQSCSQQSLGPQRAQLLPQPLKPVPPWPPVLGTPPTPPAPPVSTEPPLPLLVLPPLPLLVLPPLPLLVLPPLPLLALPLAVLLLLELPPLLNKSPPTLPAPLPGPKSRVPSVSSTQLATMTAPPRARDATTANRPSICSC